MDSKSMFTGLTVLWFATVNNDACKLCRQGTSMRSLNINFVKFIRNTYNRGTGGYAD